LPNIEVNKKEIRMGKYLFVDANNLGIRSAFANSDLKAEMIDFSEDFNPDDTLDGKAYFPTGAIHGFFRSLASFRQMYPDYYIAVVWDGGYQRRTAMTEPMVKTGVIPEVYKANRKRGEVPQAIKDFQKQKPELKKLISLTNIPQIIVNGEEADDVIASYAKQLQNSEFVAQTTDKDYYQLFRPGLWILKGDGTLIDGEWFKSEYGLEPKQWVDVAAFMGDDGDSIHGVPAWGEKTACKHVARLGDFRKVLAELHVSHDDLRLKFPDLKGDAFLALKNMETKAKHPVYPEVQEWMPFTGVAMAYEEGKVKIPKVELTALIYESRCDLAYNLKKMRDDIAVPGLPSWDRQKQAEFKELCGKYQLETVASDSEALCWKQPEQK
jgi:5'-3' exonuclease